MLSKLSINNYALINHIEIEFHHGLSIITGETGAGKSIILGALSMILGERADTSSIGNLGKKSIIEAIFDVSEIEEIKQFCVSHDLDIDDSQIILRRELSTIGRSRAFINDTPVCLQVLKELAIKLVDIHSQHQNQLISDSKYQLKIIDSIAENHDELVMYKTQFKKYVELRNKILKIKSQISSSRENEEFLKFQFDQLNRLNPKMGEQRDLESKLEILSNAESIKDELGFITSTLKDNDNSIISQLNAVKTSVNKLNPEIVSADSDIKHRIESVLFELKDISETFSDCLSGINYDPTLIAKIDSRLNNIYEINRRFKVEDSDELLGIKEEIERQLSEINTSDEDLTELEKELKNEGVKLKELANILTETRKIAASRFSEELMSEAKHLGMQNIKFSVVMSQGKMGFDGQDNVEFISTFNKNQEMQPISKVASGGEMSRIMLCVKSIVGSKMQMPTIIFDEIDTGVSGDIADRMGEMMRRISSNIQVITITHLPQVASKGLYHYKVYKSDDENTTTTNIIQLTEKERVMELAVMLSGSQIDEAAILNAQSLLKQ